MQILFSFTFNTETKDGVLTGNVPPMVALQKLQELVIMGAARAAKQKEQEQEPKKEEP